MSTEKRPVKVAMIGLGWWGRKMTAVLQKASDEIEIVCAAEPNPAGAEFAAANGFPHASPPCPSPRAAAARRDGSPPPRPHS